MPGRRRKMKEHPRGVLFSFCGPEGNRTPDLLDANEARYQLRYRPVNLRYISTAGGCLRIEARGRSGARCAALEELPDVRFDLVVADVARA